MKMANGTIGLKLSALVAAVLLGIGTVAAQQEINPDHFENIPPSHSATQPRTRGNVEQKTKQTKQAQAGQKSREDKKNQPKKVAKASTHEHGSKLLKNHS